MADVNDIYRGIISPNGGVYQPGPSVVMPGKTDPVTGMSTDALAQILIGDASGGRGGAGTGMFGRDSLNYAAPNQPNGSVVASKDQSRLTPNQFGYGENGMTDDPETAALAAIQRASPQQSKYGFTGSDPFDAYKRDYVASLRPTSLMARQAPQQQGPGGGLFGIPMSGGMNRNLAGRAGIAGIPGLPPRIQAQQAQKAVIAQALIQSGAAAPSLGYNAAYAQSAGGDGQGNNGISESGGRYGGARSLTSN